MLNPSPGLSPSAIMAQADDIFKRRGIRPKQHYSEPRAGAFSIMEMRAHSDRCQGLPEGLPGTMGGSPTRFSSESQIIIGNHSG